MNETQAVRHAAEIIKRGGVVAFPTETVYGLGADAYAPLAVARIFEVKKRPHFDPLIVHVASPDDLEKLVTGIPGPARKLMARFWPGPLTVVLPKRDEVPDIVTAGLPTVAVRMPRHAMALRFIELSGCPIAAPSANPFGYVSPTTAEHVREQLDDQIDLILDGGPCPVGVESTILSFSDEKPRLLRPGGVPLEEIESVIGKVEIPQVEKQTPPAPGPCAPGPTAPGPSAPGPSAPGMLPRHYAPRTPILLAARGEIGSYRNRKAGLLAFREPVKGPAFDHTEVLSRKGDFREAAANLFAAIRRLDALDLEVIIAEAVPETGLGRAIMDRLRRASCEDDKIYYDQAGS
jgi:L-threonylcarbamoyladenylate synthase